jgi:aromatic ring-cleaving dioxygenase
MFKPFKAHLPIRITQPYEPKFRSRINDQVLGKLTQVNHAQAGPHEELGYKVSIGDSPHAVFRDRLESQVLGEELAIDEERVTCERARTQW